MKEATITTIAAVAKADTECTAELVKAIIRICKNPVLGKRTLIPASEAMSILGVSRPTLHTLAKQGKLTEIRPTPRKPRFYLDEVEALAYTEA